ncbi:hypothetical protein HAX54_036329 [Datura stramonium]|uniref:Uncharacterized protein n=1 Tax=Datura stramonium TaxID=4076 RepID=A0ABS8VK06_DATST|nr:hypothetical protein [Datura stramonium]
MSDESSEDDVKGKSPSFGTSSNSELGKLQLEPSRLFDILTKKASYQGNFISILEIQVINRVLQQYGLSREEEEYFVVFALALKESYDDDWRMLSFIQGKLLHDNSR